MSEYVNSEAPEVNPDAFSTLEEFAMAELFEDRLQTAKPYLFNLSAQLLDDYVEREWDVLIGDDTSGRLVTRYVRQTLGNQGIQLPTAYICGAHETRTTLLPESYDQIVDSIASSKVEPERPLIVTEGIGTGTAMRFLTNNLNRRFDQTDIAAVSARFEQSLEIPAAGKIYIGGQGVQPARAVYRAFEEVKEISAKDYVCGAIEFALPFMIRDKLHNVFAGMRLTNYPYTNLVAGRPIPGYDTEQTLPVARISDDRRYRRLAHHCFKRMDALAAEFGESYD